jgi:iron complex transport system ATP-binding protein
VLAGLRVPSSGGVVLEGTPLGSLRPRERARRIAVVPQYLPSLPEVAVATFVESGRYAHVRGGRGLSLADRETSEQALLACDVSDLAGRTIAELSGGQRQRVLVARAIAQDAPVILVDEPTNALDPEHQIAVFELLARLCAEGRGALVVTHDLNLASQYATRLVLLERGKVAARGVAAEVLRREVLEPVYGAGLHYGRWPRESGAIADLPFVLARRPS